jgi:hypothetical protein
LTPRSRAEPPRDSARTSPQELLADYPTYRVKIVHGNKCFVGGLLRSGDRIGVERSVERGRGTGSREGGQVLLWRCDACVDAVLKLPLTFVKLLDQSRKFALFLLVGRLAAESAETRVSCRLAQAGLKNDVFDEGSGYLSEGARLRSRQLPSKIAIDCL